MFNVGGGELLVILLIALIVLGPDKLPEAARKVGRVTAELRRMSQGFQQEIRQAIDLSDTDTSPGGAGPSLPPSSPTTPSAAATGDLSTPAATPDASPTPSASPTPGASAVTAPATDGATADPSLLRPEPAAEGRPTDTGDASAA